MALPTSGPLSLNQIHVEAGGSSGTTASINDADIRALIGKASGATMSFSEWYGASGTVTINLTIGANTNNYNIQNSRGGTYVAGATIVNLTINSGVTVGSTSTGTYALETGSSWASGDVINIINNGTIKGRGANGGAGASVSSSSPTTGATITVVNGGNGGTGGNAFRAQFTTTFTNNGSVYGGGGGGGGGGSFASDYKNLISCEPGGGGGGGAGVNGGTGGAAGVASGGNTNGTATAGSNGTATAGGAGGLPGPNAGTGGNGGALGGNGLAGAASNNLIGVTVGTGNPGTGGTRGYYQVGSSLINSGSGIGGTVGGRSS